MAADNALNSQPVRTNSWLPALLILCVAIFACGLFDSPKANISPAFLGAYYFGYGLPAWGLFYGIFSRKRGAAINVVAFVAIYGALIGGALISTIYQKEETIKALASVQQKLARGASKPVDSNGVTTRIDRRRVDTPHTRGDWDEMLRFLNERIDLAVSQRNDYALELDAVGWDTILDATRVQNDPTLTESRVIIQQTKAIVDKYEQKTKLLMKGTEAHINSLNVSDATKKDMLMGFHKALGNESQRISKEWELEKSIISDTEKVFFLLSASRGWTVEGDHILFYYSDELARFNTYMEHIQQIGHQQEQMEEERVSETNQRLENLKQIVAM